MLFATGSSLAAVTAGRFLIGASAAFSLVGAMAVAGQWFPANRFAILSGGAMAMGMAGGVFGQAPLRLAVEASDWRTANLLLAAGGVALARRRLGNRARPVARQRRGRPTCSAGLGIVVRHPPDLADRADAGLGTSAPLLGFASLWGVPFLETAYGLPRTYGGDADVDAVRGLGRRRAAVRLAVGSHRPAQGAAAGGAGARDIGAGGPRLRSGPARARAGRPVLPGRLSRIVADRVLCAGQGEPSRPAAAARRSASSTPW